MVVGTFAILCFTYYHNIILLLWHPVPNVDLLLSGSIWVTLIERRPDYKRVKYMLHVNILFLLLLTLRKNVCQILGRASFSHPHPLPPPKLPIYRLNTKIMSHIAANKWGVHDLTLVFTLFFTVIHFILQPPSYV